MSKPMTLTSPLTQAVPGSTPSRFKATMRRWADLYLQAMVRHGALIQEAGGSPL